MSKEGPLYRSFLDLYWLNFSAALSSSIIFFLLATLIQDRKRVTAAPSLRWAALDPCSSTEFLIFSISSDEKEVIEQKIVTDYIIDFLNENSDNIVYDKKPKIKNSSDIEHLCTSFNADLVNDKNILDLLGEIHPTPAIGGYPKDKAFDMIRKYKENRGWYGGPIGWIDNNLDGRFYLNIRSGLGVNKDLYLFSGSGITEKSNADNEWDETEHKFKSMLESL